MTFLAHHNTFIAGAAGSGKSFLIKQTSEFWVYNEKDLCNKHDWTRTEGFKKNKAKTIHSFAEIGDCHETKEVCCVFHVLCGCFFVFFVSEKYMFK